MSRAGMAALLGAALFGTAGPALAADAPITLEQALALARRNNHSLALERGRLAEAQTAVEQVSSALLPTIAGQARFTRNYKEVNIPFGGVNLLLQPLDQTQLRLGTDP